MNGNIVLVLLAAVGTAGLIGAVFLMGFNTPPLIADEAAARHFAYLYAPEFPSQSAILSADQKSALVSATGNILFLVTMLGDGPVVRKLSPRDVIPLTTGVLAIDVQDVGFPRREFRADPIALDAMIAAFKKSIEP